MSRRDKRARKVLLQGLAVHEGERFRFLTLTGVKSLKNHFQPLVRWLREKMRFFEYFGVYTGEGIGVIHLVYVGKAIKLKELRAFWLDLTDCWNISITAVRNQEGIIEELCRQFRVKRYISSKDWLKPRFRQQSLSI